MFFNKPKSYLGIDLGAGGVKLVELRQEKGRPVLFTYGMTAVEQRIHTIFNKPEKQIADLAGSKQPRSSAPQAPTIDESQVGRYAEILRAVCKQSRTVSTTAVVSLPVSAVFHAIVTLPMVKKQEFEPILRAEVKKLLPYPLEETALDYQVLPSEDQKSQQILVNAVPRSLVVFYSKIFKQAGLKLDSLEPESIALSRSLVGRDGAVTMIVDMGAERTNFFIVEKTVPITHHSIEVGGQRVNAILSNVWGVESAQVEQMKKDLFSSGIDADRMSPRAFMDAFAPVVDPIIKEIEYGFEVYLRQSGNERKIPEKIVLTGGAAQFPFLVQHLAEKFKMKCYVADPWGRVVYQDSLKPILHAIGPRMSVAIGLALRNMV